MPAGVDNDVCSPCSFSPFPLMYTCLFSPLPSEDIAITAEDDDYDCSRPLLLCSFSSIMFTPPTLCRAFCRLRPATAPLVGPSFAAGPGRQAKTSGTLPPPRNNHGRNNDPGGHCPLKLGWEIAMKQETVPQLPRLFTPAAGKDHTRCCPP